MGAAIARSTRSGTFAGPGIWRKCRPLWYAISITFHIVGDLCPAPGGAGGLSRGTDHDRSRRRRGTVRTAQHPPRPGGGGRRPLPAAGRELAVSGVFVPADQRLDDLDQLLHPLFEAASGPAGRVEDVGQVLEPVGGGDKDGRERGGVEF